MKSYLVIIFVLVFVAASNAQNITCPELLRSWASILVPHVCKCIAKTGADPVIVDNWIHYGEYPNDEDLKCTIKCIFLKLKVFNKHGKVSEEVFKSVIPFSDPEKVQEIYETCSTLEGEDLCDTAYLMDKCVFEQVTDVLCPGEYNV